MDSLQAKRANATSFQLRLRDKTQPVIKTTHHLSGEAWSKPLYAKGLRLLASDFRDFPGSINSCTAVLWEV